MQKEKYLLNTTTQKVHLSDSQCKRCGIKGLSENEIIYFSSFEEAMQYPSEDHPLAKPCAICFKQYRNERKKK